MTEMLICAYGFVEYRPYASHGMTPQYIINFGANPRSFLKGRDSFALARILIIWSACLVLRPLSLRVRIRKGELEVEMSGSSEQISSEIDGVKTLMGRLEDAFFDARSGGGEGAVIPPANLSSLPGQDSVPSVGRVASGSEAITRLLSTEWGAKPRNIGEIRSALASNAMPYPNTTISGILVHLVKAGKVKRWKTPEGYVYRENARGTP
jgi:hypothetical protein